METFRSNHARTRHAVLVAIFALAAIACDGISQTASGSTEVALIQKDRIEHVTPRRDYVGPLPATLEWTAVSGVDTYSIAVENEIEIEMFAQDGIKTTSVPWPKEARLEPGTYYWRIVGVKDGHIVADSGRAAFLVREP